MKKKKIYYLIIILVLLIPIIFSEIYLRKIGLGDPIRYDSDFVYGYSPKENQNKKRFKGTNISINDVGLRSIVDWKKSNNKKKIVFYGDSVTYGGSYIDDKKTFSHLICNDPQFKDYVCGNAGVNAYGIHNIIYRSKYDERLKNIDKKIFILISDDFYRGLQNSNTAHFYLNNKKFLFSGIFEALNFIGTKYDLNLFIGKKNDTSKYEHKKELIQESINLIQLEVNNMISKKQDYLLFFSAGKNVKKIDEMILKKLKNNFKEKFIDLSYIHKNNMFYDNTHYNEIGHKIIANEIASIIKKFN